MKILNVYKELNEHDEIIRKRSVRVERFMWILVLLFVGCVTLWSRKSIVGVLLYIYESPAFPLFKGDNAPPYSIGIIDSVVISLARVMTGTGLGFMCGIIFGLIMAQVSYIGPRLHFFFLALAPLAPIVWLPVFMKFLGIGSITAVMIVAVGSVFISTVVVYYLATHPNSTYIDLVRLMGANRWEILRHVTLPSMLPMLLLLFRVNLFSGWMALLAAEMVGANAGLGAMLMMGRSLGNLSIVYVATALIAVLAFTLDTIVSITATRLVQRRYGAWVFLTND